jgi:hypothetical protein
MGKARKKRGLKTSLKYNTGEEEGIGYTTRLVQDWRTTPQLPGASQPMPRISASLLFTRTLSAQVK